MDRHLHSRTIADQEVRFGPFRFQSARPALFRADARVAAGRKALQVLAVLLEHPGRLVATRELMARVWPGDAMHGNNLAVHLRRLRQALGDDARRPTYIATVNGRGYRFVAPVERPDVLPQPHALPAPPGRAIGRTEAMAAVRALCARRRLVTIVGPGGIGKTVLALTLARAMETGGDVVRFLDLGLCGWADRAIGEVAGSLDTPAGQGRMVLVLDGCEHMGEATATCVERLLASVPGLRILATSRAPLALAGEALHWLAPLAHPATDSALTAAQALRFPAVALFAERAARQRRGYRLCDAEAPAVAAICARLEGHPMAIELAAQRIDTLGARDIAARLDDRLSLLRSGRQAGRTRLAAAFDWSYAALPEPTRRVLRGLAVLAGPFTLDAAVRTLARERLDAQAVVDAVGELVASSLLQAIPVACGMRYRLTATVRPYALDKLDEVNAQRALPLHRARGIHDFCST